MNRSRALVAAVLSVVLLAVAAPALEARPLAKPQVSVSALGGEWLSAAWSWLAQALRIDPATPAARQEKVRSDPGTTTGSGGLGGARPMTGSCIDPNGGCIIGGGGG
jgi:hypothetical protein